jgi:plastocyanin
MASRCGPRAREVETRTFQSGETLRVEANLAPGVYEIECYVGDHEERGMKAYLEVRDDAPLATPASDGPGTGVARIVQFAFVPATLDVPAGTEVSWRNDDPAPHTVTSADGAFDSLQLDQGEAYSVVLDAPGVYLYRCEIHPTMVGEVRVH